MTLTRSTAICYLGRPPDAVLRALQLVLGDLEEARCRCENERAVDSAVRHWLVRRRLVVVRDIESGIPAKCGDRDHDAATAEGLQ